MTMVGCRSTPAPTGPPSGAAGAGRPVVGISLPMVPGGAPVVAARQLTKRTPGLPPAVGETPRPRHGLMFALLGAARCEP